MDDYLSNKLDPGARAAFEEKLKTDPNLKSEFELQQQFIEGIKNARIAELKTIMNNIAIPPASTGASVVAKVVLFAAVAGVIGTGLYYFLDQPEKTETPVIESIDSRPDTQEEPDVTRPSDNSADVPREPASAGQKPVDVPEPVDRQVDETSPQAQAPAPQIEVFDPSEEMEEDNSPVPIVENPTRLNHNPAIEVVIENSNKKYDFHYQFRDGKLFLYGPIEKDLYEILEIFSEDRRTMFLYLDGKYYFLKTNSEKLTPLRAIEDDTLIRKLDEYRN